MRRLPTLWWSGYNITEISIIGENGCRDKQIGEIGDINGGGINDAISTIGTTYETVNVISGYISNIDIDRNKISLISNRIIGQVG